ncbi:PREDICTED: putative thiosulfate sulfurtransferase, mitochondrial isoform X2 [Vollenhovia emeryi]|uniref:putative thiosulfate sulfurtransferase, mitochondrial isoform X2 n=1 Tax=Vollenhovia emeryi TaxID=411798 RepID=UPI0005F3FE40|nr:PREDICTED: putative thiosulfate sulfurtransferase, mitochondrial isoform X2 [Vollenhovia emeryi]
MRHGVATIAVSRCLVMYNFSRQLRQAYVSLSCFLGNRYALPLAWSRRRFLEITFNRWSAGNNLTRTLHSSNISCLKRDIANLCKKKMASSKPSSGLLDFEISYDEFKAKVQQLEGEQETPTVWIIDVRQPSEIKETSSIPGSINIPLDTITQVFKEMSAEDFMNEYKKPKPSVDNEIIFSCMSGRRSQSAVKQLEKLNYKKVYSFSGGWSQWDKEKKREEEGKK